ncbi:MAG: hypothetical protein GX587_12040, partial [Bacteroidales bacterium]|nr:hypothetical protein [Bacteroidales bacterium]
IKELEKSYGKNAEKEYNKEVIAEEKFNKKLEKQKAAEEEKSRKTDPFAMLDFALSSVFVSMGRGLGQTMADIGGAIKAGASAAWEGIKDFGESFVNLFTDGSFSTDETLIQQEEQRRYDDEKRRIEENKRLAEEKNKKNQSDKKAKLLKTALENKNDVDYFKGIVSDRGGSWNEKGVNIVGIRDDSVASGSNTYDDMFIVIVDGEIKGAFAGSTDPGKDRYDYNGKTSEQMGGTFHMEEGSFDFRYYTGSKTDSANKYNDTLRPDKEITGNRDANANGNIDLNTSETDLKSGGYNIWFHFGGKTNAMVSKMSLGCQVIAGDKYWNAEKNELIDNYGSIRYENGNKQGAYNDFLRIVKSGVSSNKIIKYNLIHNSRINNNVYEKYKHRLSR